MKIKYPWVWRLGILGLLSLLVSRIKDTQDKQPPPRV